MNGAQSLIRTLVDSEVEVCFANPGTSEMQFVSALDDVFGMRAVLGLFEGVVTGAADGYARMADKPAATLLHLGPGLSNGLANLHNARRAFTPIVNVVGDHALSHKRFDAPLESDIDSLARTVSGWVRRSYRPQDVGADIADAVAAATRPLGQIATLILPADVSWGDGGTAAPRRQRALATEVPDSLVSEAAKIFRSNEPAILMLGGLAQRERGLRAASRIAVATGARVLTETFPVRLQRGAGIPAFDRLGYFSEQAAQQTYAARHIVLAGTRSPVAFFGYPGRPSSLVPEGCEVLALGDGGQRIVEALEELADLVAGDAVPILQPLTRAKDHRGLLDMDVVAELVGAHLPEGAIVVEEAITGSPSMAKGAIGSPPHDWLTLTGGAIGDGIPMAVGAAVACPDRRVFNLQADGSAMYTFQGLWTQARENLNVTTVILSNRSYAILKVEMERAGARVPRDKASALLDLSNPELDFVKLAKGLGVDGEKVRTAEDLTTALQRSVNTSGPFLIEASI